MDPVSGAAGLSSLLCVSLVCLGVAAVIGLPFVLVVVQTIQGKGRWGINPSTVHCPSCGTKAPKVRKPANARQAMWGGWTCAECGTEMDKWGKEITD